MISNLGRELMATQPKLVTKEAYKTGRDVYWVIEMLKLKPVKCTDMLNKMYLNENTAEKFRIFLLRVAEGTANHIPQAEDSDIGKIAYFLSHMEVTDAAILDSPRDGVFKMLVNGEERYIVCDNTPFAPGSGSLTNGTYFCSYNEQEERIETVTEDFFWEV